VRIPVFFAHLCSWLSRNHILPVPPLQPLWCFKLTGWHCSDLFFSAAKHRLTLETGYISLESVQARLMQCLYLLDSSRANQAWYHFGSTIQLVFAQGMHRRRTLRAFSDDGTYIINECRKRTFWSAYTLDRYLGVLLGRPRIFQDDDIDQEYPARVNDEDMAPTGARPQPIQDDCLGDALIYLAKLVFSRCYRLLPYPAAALLPRSERTRTDSRSF
jgi:hypothetical protein